MRQAYLYVSHFVGRFALYAYDKLGLSGRVMRVRVIIVNERHQVLLIKNVVSRNKNWTLPGGGVEYGESPNQTAVRELWEELKLRVELDDLEFMADVLQSQTKLRYDIPLFRLQINWFDPADYNKVELADAAWFDVDLLPDEHSVIVKTATKYMR